MPVGDGRESRQEAHAQPCRAGQSFTQFFGRAAWSPTHDLPTLGDKSVGFLPDALKTTLTSAATGET